MFGTLIAIEGIVPAPYAARFNWVLMTNPKALSQKMLKALLTDSYQMVAAGLPAKVRKELGLETRQNKSRSAKL
jgi:predicted DNA-binding protein (MmcQ/YjbR family)